MVKHATSGGWKREACTQLGLRKEGLGSFGGWLSFRK
jgi:hypothetical protein